MNIKISHVDTFNLIKGILSVVKDTNSAESFKELDNVLEQMNAVPTTNDCGYFVDEDTLKPDPRTPEEKMQEKFCDIFDEAKLGVTAFDMNERHGDEPVPGFFGAWDEFLSSIGGAPMVVAYAGVKLRRKFEAAGKLTWWIDICVDYYDAHWKV